MTLLNFRFRRAQRAAVSGVRVPAGDRAFVYVVFSGKSKADGTGVGRGDELDPLDSPLCPLVELGALCGHSHFCAGEALPVRVLRAKEGFKAGGYVAGVHAGEHLCFHLRHDPVDDKLGGVVFHEGEAFSAEVVVDFGVFDDIENGALLAYELCRLYEAEAV